MNRIKELRQKRNITQIRLSTEIEVSQETISAYENGKAEPRLDNLVKIADFLNTSTDYLLGRIDDDSPLVDLANNVVDKQLNELINNYARLNNLQRKDLIWYSGIIENKDLK
ncbi:MAG TPA: helix-turn-helix domain-containing protein [Candidatus Coprovivens excrementavium]|nr:helix-turn-helix domain-containing protein [Candidatus Coprovivens excrementavium]